MSFSFKRSEVDTSQGEFAPIAAGKYHIEMQDLRERETQAGGIQWSAMFKIVAGEKFVGRTFWVNWNVVNESEKAQNIARAEISHIADLLNLGDDISVETLKTSTVFDIVLDVGEYLGKPDYKVKSWKLAETAAPQKTFTTGKAAPKAAPTTKPAEAPAKPAAKKQPWAK